MRATFFLSTLFIVFVLTLQAGSTAYGDPAVVLVPGILLSGAPTDSAVNGMRDFSAPRTAADVVTVSDSSSGMTFYRSQLSANISPTATVGEVNAALSGVGARVVFSLLKNPVVTIQAPMPSSLAELQVIVERLRATGAFSSVVTVAIPQKGELPPGDSPTLPSKKILPSPRN